VKLAGVASEALADAGLAVPLAQESETVTLAALLGTKSLFTVNVSVFSVLIIVQFAVPPSLIATLTHAPWFAV
jgi:hypothetical protein